MQTLPVTPPISSSGTVNLKSLLIMAVITIIIAIIVSKVMKNEVTLYDANGNPIGTGEVTTKLRALSKS